MHELVATHPTVAVVLEKVAKLEAEQQTYRASVEAVMTPYREAVADWDRERAAALKTGRQVPPKPPEPDLGDTARDEQEFVHQHARLREELKQAIAAAAPELEEQFAAWEQDWLAKARKSVAEVRRLTAEAADVLNAVREVRSAVDTADPNTRPMHGLAARTRKQIDAHDMLDAVGSGQSLLALEPTTVQFETVLPANDGSYRPAGRMVPGAPPPMVAPRSLRRRGEI
jgi:hypothetical protein